MGPILCVASGKKNAKPVVLGKSCDVVLHSPVLTSNEAFTTDWIMKVLKYRKGDCLHMRVYPR